MSPRIVSASENSPPAPMPLQRAERGELVHRLGERARHRADDEDRDRGEEERLAAVDVGELAVQRRRDRARDEERRGGPGLLGQPAEVVGDRADRRGDDVLVERGQEHAEQQPDQDRQDLAVGELTAVVRVSAVAVVIGSLRVLADRRRTGPTAWPAGGGSLRATRTTPRRPWRCGAGGRRRTRCSPAGVTASRWARPSAGSTRRSTSPASTSAATLRLTVDGSVPSACAISPTRCGPFSRSTPST